MALWSGQNPYATKKQLVSSISGLYDDLQDISGFNLQNLTVSTLTAKNWISTPELYVSSIIGGGIQVQNGLLQISTGDLSLLSLSSLSFKGLDLGGFDLSFDLGLGDAIGGALAGLGAAIGGVGLGIGVGAGLGIKSLVNGLASLAQSRTGNFLNSYEYETVAGTTQLQISTLGNAFPLYSTIFRTVSSVSANQVPGAELLLSTFFTPGTTCIRSVSDPLALITGDPALQESTIQSFGQWTPLPVGQLELISSFPDISLSNTTDNPLLLQERYVKTTNNKALMNSLQWATSSNDLPFPATTPYPNIDNITRLLYNRDEYDIINSFISTSYVRYQSTYTTIPDPFYIRSTLSSPLELTYTNNVAQGDFAFCEPDETGFRSTMEVDLIANGAQSLFIQWGLAVDNLNSTIAAGTAKRVSWDILANTSNFIDIPQPVSTIVNEGTTQQIIDLKTNPYEIQLNTFGTGMNPSQIAFNINGATFGSNTTLSNYNNYPYQFNSSVYINGTLEANTIIALSSIFATSTFVDTQVSTASIIADIAQITELYNKEGYISSLRSSSNNPGNDYITTLSRVRMAGYQTPLAIITGNGTDIYDTRSRFDFVTDSAPQSIYLQSQPNNKTLAYFYSTNIEIPNLVVENLLASNLTYGQATAVDFATSTISFGWTGNFDFATPVQYAMNQNLITPPGINWIDYNAAKYQTLKIMNFCNTVNMVAQQFSTTLTAQNNSFGSSNIQGWASTIFYNNSFAPFARVNLVQNAGQGEISLQAQTNPIIVSLNSIGDVGGPAINILPGTTVKFQSAGSTWTNTGGPPTPGFVQYNNQLQMYMDFETVNISTTDTLSFSAETIKLNGQVVAPNLQLSNLYLNGFLSTGQVIANGLLGYTAANFPTSVNNAVTQPFNMINTTTTTDGLINSRATLNPSRGFNLFNSYNFNEWNNTIFTIDTNTAAGRPTIIVGEVLATTPPAPAYSGQFWINNTVDSPALVIPIYVNQEGFLNQIGAVSGNTYARIFTTNGTLWSVANNVGSPQGTVVATLPNFYTVQMNSELTTINSGMPLVYNSPSIVYNNNKTFFYSPQIRVATLDAPSFNTREAGMESTSYFDSNIIFSKMGATAFWQSDAFNPILNMYQNTYYSVAGWTPTVSLNRLRISGNSVSSWELTPTAYPVGGGATDYVWGTARYVKIITDSLSPSGDLREDYLMIPKNYFNFIWQGQGPLNG